MDKKHRICLYCIYYSSLFIIWHLKISEKLFYSVKTDLYSVWQSPATHLRAGCVILLERGTPLVPTKEAGRGRELRGTADWLVLAFRGCGTKVPLALMG